MALPGATPTSSNTAFDAANRIQKNVEYWKRQLLDLSKRNRALNFKPLKVATVSVVDEQPAEVFRRLCLEDGAMRFQASSTVESDPEEITTRGEFEEDQEVGVTEQTLVPYNRAQLDERHTDDWLQTSSTPEHLDRALRRLEEIATSTIEEQGVNTLFLALGMLNYVESVDSEIVLRAPIVLVPVFLSREGANSGYEIRATDDEPIVNPALVELLKKDHNIELPELPESDTLKQDFDLNELLVKIGQLILRMPRWSVTKSMYVAQFSFQKFVMYKDLESNAEAFRQHRLVRNLVSRSGTDLGSGLPRDIREMRLDDEFPPERTFHVVDADSSQLRALAAVSRNYDLVIEGPPGTGKSQTITNLIAQALASNKSVLFVAEKMAALQVVYSRLSAAGLGDFCLELHSTKANKRLVMKNLATALDSTLVGIAGSTTSSKRLPGIRSKLTKYVDALHHPYGALNLSPFAGFGALGPVASYPRFVLIREIDDVTCSQLQDAERDLGDLGATASALGNPAAHPFRDACRTFLSEADLDEIESCLRRLISGVEELRADAAAATALLKIPQPQTFADVDVASKLAEVFARSPGAPHAVLQSDAWNSVPEIATKLIARGRKMSRLRESLLLHVCSEALETGHATDIAYVEKKCKSALSFLRMLSGRYRSIRLRWIRYRNAAYQPTVLGQAAEMRRIDWLRHEQQVLRSAEREGRALFGPLWKGDRSAWDDLDTYVKWVVEFRALCVRHGLSSATIEVASHPTTDTAVIVNLQRRTKSVKETIGALRQLLEWPEDYLALGTFAEIEERAEAMVHGLVEAPRWSAFARCRSVVERGLAAELLPLAMAGEMSFEQLPRIFRRAFYSKWLAKVVRARPELEQFNSMTHEERVAEFKQLDLQVLGENRASLVGQLRDQVQQKLVQTEAKSAMTHLRPELMKQRGHKPLRKTIRKAEAAIRAIKPCLLMSPQTVAQYIDGSKPSFDLVIFDEASQLPTEDAIGAICRATQVVVVGDPKQLPPTNFFAVSGQVDAPRDEEGELLVSDTESVLEEFMGAGMSTSRLKWHYRSAHESLIRFSNVNFYDSELCTFPSAELGNSTLGLNFEFVPEGIYEGKGLNRAEARRVADAVVTFAREQIEAEKVDRPLHSLAVGTFNLRQQIAIQDELESRRRSDPSIEPFFARTSEKFFVKNLESIQGDERDVIYLSVTYARAEDGKLRYNFGPLNSENGWRRLNVITTRARRLMRVFSSIRGDDISITATNSSGARLLREYLIFAERGILESAIASANADAESPFEQEVLNELSRRGYRVVPQVGTSGYRVDIGILDQEHPGRFICGIECDGVAYHSSETARDRDRLRQQVLELRGWTIHRLWSTDWFKDRRGQIDRLVKLIEQSKAKEYVAPVAPPAQNDIVEAPRVDLKRIEVRAQSPAASPYVMTMPINHASRTDLLSDSSGRVTDAILAVVETEAPIHETDLLTRVASMWDNRAGARISQRILRICASLERQGKVSRKGEFLCAPFRPCVVRSRHGTRIPADRISPEEYRAAILAILQSGGDFPRDALISEVRAMFGFSRTGDLLEGAIVRGIESLFAEGCLGEGAAGIRLRRAP